MDNFLVYYKPFLWEGAISIGWTIDNVLSKTECDFIIEQSKKFLIPSTILSGESEYRTSRNCFVPYEHPLCLKIAKCVQDLIKDIDDVEIPIDHFESLQVVNYKSGEYYKEHEDYFYTDSKEDQVELKKGGQRTWTALIYLNTMKGRDGSGGTEFTKQHKTIYPKIGRMVIWRNLINGRVLESTQHQGLAPIGCEKWVCNVWVREGKFG